MPLEGGFIAGPALGKPLRHWTDAQLAQVEACLYDVWRDWAHGWDLSAPTGAPVHASRADTAIPPFAPWYALHGSADDTRRAWLAFGVPGLPPTQALCQALFGAPVAGPIATEAAGAAWSDLLATLARAAGIQLNDLAQAPAPEAADCDAWAGAVLVDLPMRGNSVRLLLSGACVDTLLPAASRSPVRDLLPVGAALERQRIRLMATLATAELSVSSLRKLAIDDCVVLPHPLHEPLTVRASDGVQLCLACLGQQAGYRALELLAVSTLAECNPAVSAATSQAKEPHVLSMDAPLTALGAAEPIDNAAPGAQLIELAELDGSAQAQRGVIANQDELLRQIRTRLQVSVGEVALTVGELLAAREQQVVRLDRRVDQPVDLLLEGAVVARGQLVAVDGCFAVRITDLPSARQA